MSREKQRQLEEMAKDLCSLDCSCEECLFTKYSKGSSKCSARKYAERAYNAGYRKHSENTVDVIRCKDCVYFEERHYEELGDIPYIKFGCKWSNYSRNPDDYCSLAEAKMKGGE